jgi:hypothetical protein
MNFSGNDTGSTAFQQAPTNAVNKSDLTVDGLNLNMATGKIFVWGGNKNINTIIKDLSVTGSPTLHTTGGTGLVKKFYDFRAFSPVASPVGGSYMTEQQVTLSLNETAISPIDATGATIVYTTDGTDPNASSTPYTGPVTVSSTTTIKVAAIKDGFAGKSVTVNYILTGTGNEELINNGPIHLLSNVISNQIETNGIVKRILVTDLSGHILFEKTNINQLNVSALPAGIYLVKISQNDNSWNSYKIIKL